MQLQDLNTLISELAGSMGQPTETQDPNALQRLISPILGNDLQQVTTAPTPPPALPPPPVGKVTISSEFPFQHRLLTESPAVFKSMLNRPVETEPVAGAGHSLGAGILNNLKIKIPFPIHITEVISVFLPSDTVNPALILPVTINNIIIIPFKHTSYPVAAGSIWIRSNLLNSTAPAGTYSGLTISGGTISFDQPVNINNKAITMAAGSVCTVNINLKQPVDTTVSPDNIGIDAMNAKVQLPASFSFTMTGSAVTITSVADSSWQLYGNATTFQFDPAQTPVYNAVLNGIYIGCKANPATFTVSQCQSPFLTLQGTALIIDSYWELPVATIDITQTNNATGAGSLAALCGLGLQANWVGLKGGPVNLLFPLLSATVGAIAINDLFASNRYATQHYDLWANEKTGMLSTLDIGYGNLFGIYYLSQQDGEELLSTSAGFIANIDRPVRVDDSPVSVKGTSAIIYQVYTPANKIFFLYDGSLIAQNYPAPPGGVVTDVPQEAIALTNGLLTVTPASGVALYGLLDTPNKFKQAKLVISFGLFYLLPALPDPYASSFLLSGFRDVGVLAGNDQTPSTLPLSAVKELLTGMVSWPLPPANPGDPQLADLSFVISPLANNKTFAAIHAEANTVFTPDAVAFTPQEIWDANTKYGPAALRMLDVSTNADLMGVAFSTTGIQAINVQTPAGGEVYTIQPIDNSAEADMLQILGLDLSTPGKFIRAFMVPEITWEPNINLSQPDPGDPPLGWFLFPDDGGPTQLFNNSPDVVSIAPIPVSNFVVDTYTKGQNDTSLVTASLFTLPFGIRSLALFPDSSQYPAGVNMPTLSIEPQDYDITPLDVPKAPKKVVSSGLQIAAKGKLDTTKPGTSASFLGFSMQMRNLLNGSGNPLNASILGPDVDTIFNGNFGPPSIHPSTPGGVPLERIDFSGYGASTFSNWVDPFAQIAATSQAKFDVVVGRTAYEVIQVKTKMYPFSVPIVRTITIYRSGSAMIYRVDSGWHATGPGVYDYSYTDHGDVPMPNDYTFHPGVVKGVYNVKNIIEPNLPQYKVDWFLPPGSVYIDPATRLRATVPPGPDFKESVILQPAYFDAEVQMDNVIHGAVDGRVPTKKMLGYVQLSPPDLIIAPEIMNGLMQTLGGSIGGPVDCIVNIGGSGQTMRVTRVDVAASTDPSKPHPIFAGTARGAVVLPKDGSWSIVQHSQATDVVSAIENNTPVPLIRVGELLSDLSSDYPGNQLRLANPSDLLKVPDSSTINFGLLQNTGTQKVMYQLPAFLQGVTNLLSKDNNFPLAKYADAFHLVNSTSIFPNLGDLPDMDLTNYGIQLLDQGYKLLNNLDPGKLLQQALPSPWYFVNTKDVKLYIEYNPTDQNGDPSSNLNYDLDSTVEKWVNSAKSITLNVDLGPFTKMVFIDGDFDSQSGDDSAFNIPKLQFGPDLKPIVDILQILESLSGGDYAAVAKKALDIAMSNGGDNFEYKFHADKEIATIQFPPAEADGPTTPLRLTAGLKVGAYFNETISITTDPSTLLPSAGAYFEFDGGMQVMCVSLAAATVYAVGQVAVKLSADIKTGPALYMKFGFGVELMVGLPVVGNVSVTYEVGIEMTLSSTEIKITAFLLFKGEADLLGGLVDITITIEASGTCDRQIGGPETLTAQVTFAIDISIFLVIDINFSKSWSESRQIA